MQQQKNLKSSLIKGGMILLGLFVYASSMAQDIHYSQFNSSPKNLTPAQTGLFDGDWRFVGNYRSQWSAIPVPYKTFSLAADTRFRKLLKNDVPAAGLVINTDKAGDSRFTTLQALASIAYIKKLTSDSMNFVSLAIQPGFTTKSFDVNALTFDNQYNGDVFDKNLLSGENFSKTRITYFELGAGAAYLWKKNARNQVNIGVSALHLTQPKQSFFNNDKIELDIKTCVSGLAEFPVAAKLDVIPTFMFQSQGKFKETVVGGFGKYYLKPIDGQTTAISFGAFYRLKDAFILVANMDYRNFNVGVSYDVNTSRLIAATNRRGAFELSIIYIFKKEPVFIAKKRICPIYM